MRAIFNPPLVCVCSLVWAVTRGEGLDIDGDIEHDTAATEGFIERCAPVMERNGFSHASFRHGAGHGIHSLSLEEIRHFFEPNAPIENKIPVVNLNLSSEQVFLPNAPLAGYNEHFKTMSMKVMSYIMLNDRPDFGMTNLNTLEKVGHWYHMHEIYAIASEMYREMKLSPPLDPELCPCVNDVVVNGVMDELVNVSMKFHNPILHSDHCIYHRPEEDMPSWGSTAEKEALIEYYVQKYIEDSTKGNAVNLLILKPPTINSLVARNGSKQWVLFEAWQTNCMLEEEEMKGFTVFMYCKLNRPLDHPIQG